MLNTELKAETCFETGVLWPSALLFLPYPTAGEAVCAKIPCKGCASQSCGNSRPSVTSYVASDRDQFRTFRDIRIMQYYLASRSSLETQVYCHDRCVLLTFSGRDIVKRIGTALSLCLKTAFPIYFNMSLIQKISMTYFIGFFLPTESSKSMGSLP